MRADIASLSTVAAGAYLRAMKVRVTREIDKDEGRLRALVTEVFDRMHVDEWQYSPDSPDSVMCGSVSQAPVGGCGEL